ALDDLATVTDADEQLERELLEDLDARGREALQEIDDALARIDDGSYGRCARCGGTILAARLEVIPHARNCVPCERSRASGRWRPAHRLPPGGPPGSPGASSARRRAGRAEADDVEPVRVDREPLTARDPRERTGELRLDGRRQADVGHRAARGAREVVVVAEQVLRQLE